MLALLVPAGRARAEAQVFASPQDAARALVEASRANDEAALRRLVDEEYAELVLDSDDPAIGERRQSFAEGADKRLEFREDGPDRVTLVVGLRAYPFPLPLVRSERGWQFDAAAGAEEIVDRTVVHLELLVERAQAAGDQLFVALGALARAPRLAAELGQLRLLRVEVARGLLEAALRARAAPPRASAHARRPSAAAIGIALGVGAFVGYLVAWLCSRNRD